MANCGNGNDLCWGRTDPVTLLFRTFTNKQKETDKLILSSALAVIKENDTLRTIRTIDTKNTAVTDSGNDTRSSSSSPEDNDSSSIPNTSVLRTVTVPYTNDDEIHYTEVIHLILKQLRNDGYTNIRLQNDGPNNEYESHIPTSTIARGIILGTLKGTVNNTAEQRNYNFSAVSTTSKNNNATENIQDRILVFPLLSRCTLKIGSEGCLYITGTKEGK
jgi:hypothetical protein